MTEIPADVMRAAQTIFEDAPKINFPVWGQPGLTSAVELATAEAFTARAVMAERERCAQIADDPARNVAWTPREIAAAIRGEP